MKYQIMKKKNKFFITDVNESRFNPDFKYFKVFKTKSSAEKWIQNKNLLNGIGFQLENIEK